MFRGIPVIICTHKISCLCHILGEFCGLFTLTSLNKFSFSNVDLDLFPNICKVVLKLFVTCEIYLCMNTFFLLFFFLHIIRL